MLCILHSELVSLCCSLAWSSVRQVSLADGATSHALGQLCFACDESSVHVYLAGGCSLHCIRRSIRSVSPELKTLHRSIVKAQSGGCCSSADITLSMQSPFHALLQSTASVCLRQPDIEYYVLYYSVRVSCLVKSDDIIAQQKHKAK